MAINYALWAGFMEEVGKWDRILRRIWRFAGVWRFALWRFALAMSDIGGVWELSTLSVLVNVSFISCLQSRCEERHQTFQCDAMKREGRHSEVCSKWTSKPESRHHNHDITAKYPWFAYVGPMRLGQEERWPAKPPYKL